ncbi:MULTISPECIES: hypothetical protein [unclassified Nonomuraea]|uniref:hypothetical protein n=1 Tax=unclassified Nonomuraea TaxID=2593643 RepID=UPI0035C227DA
MSIIKRAALVSTAVVAGIVTLTAVAPPPAFAGTALLNGAVINDSAYPATAIRNWCLSGGSTGTLTTTRPTCGSDQASRGLAPRGGRTPSNEDWDVVQIDAGWCYYVKFALPGQPDNHTRYDRRGKSMAYVKVEDFAAAHVVAQSTSTCP